ncbi:MAG TPA: HD domain-containing phosphohydrolase [Thermodesulfovibrionales bacterium]|nr:HD domain-containing phosphohydrolase [Thermodesulfovibrionales bacterium]
MSETGEIEGNILIVDDDPSVLDFISSALMAFHYPVICSKNAGEALALLQRNAVVAVLSDIRMPGVSGLGLIERIHDINPEIPVILMTGYAEVDTAIEAINKGAFSFLLKPFKTDYLIRAVEKALKYHRMAEAEKDYRVMLEDTVLRRTRELAETATMASSLSVEIIERLSAIAEFRDSATGAHVSRIGLYSAKIAEAMGMYRDFVEKIGLASSLHDIGKIGIPDNILLKPGLLTEEEFEIIKRHTTIGAKMLSGSADKTLQMAESIALNHHESWCGEGYPRGLKGVTIPVEGRIVRLADEYDALRSKRPYKLPLNHGDAFRVITEGDGRTSPEHFDPDVFKAFILMAPFFDEVFTAHQDKHSSRR